ncbi:hypothetical protein [Actinomadura terrae]|uniref:hypothetical protein n=1 Tax=Actinomadura terrae TaxID=604353 RepID=UPI001FA74767|nr:hypothetical protein [Actinomadura terrae]
MPDKEIAARLRAARKARGLTVADLAELFRDVASERVARRLPALKDLERTIRGHEAGEHTAGPRYRILYARAFGVPEGELFSSGENVVEPDGLGLALVGAASSLGTEGRPADADFVGSLRGTNQDLIRLDSLWGGHDLFPVALRAFRVAYEKLGSGAYESRVERDLLAAAGETGEVAAWLAYDADRQDESRWLAHEALMLSRHAGDRDMELLLLSHLAMQALHLHRPREALRIIAEVADDEQPPRVSALFQVRRGRALAQLGDERAAAHMFGLAEAGLKESVTSRDPHWTWWLDGTEVTRHRATAYAQLGQWEHALPLREGIVENCRGRYPYGRLDLVQLLNALAHVRDWERAEEVLIEISGDVGAVGPGRSASLLHAVCELVRRADGVPSTVVDAAVELLAAR